MHKLYTWLLMLVLGRAPMPPPRAPPTFSLESLYQGWLALGSSGSGKTSGALDTVLRETVLPSGAGILWLVAKGEEAKRALRLAEKAGRLHDVIEFNPSSGRILDPVDVELRFSNGHGTVESAASLLSDLVNVSGGSASGGDSPYWAQSSERCLRRLIHCVFMATGKASLESLYLFMLTVPQSPDSLKDSQWKKTFCAECLQAIEERTDTEGVLTLTYWRDFWPSWNDRTRSIVESMITNILDQLVAGICGKMLNGESNLLPQCLRQGKILILTPSTLEGKEPARYLAIMLKQLVQRMATRFSEGTPVAIVADEYQQFVAKMKDEADFQAIARSHRVMLIAASQTLPVLALNTGGKGMNDVHALVGSMATKVLHASTCPTTNAYFSSMIGDRIEITVSGNTDERFSPWDEIVGNPGRGLSFGQTYRPAFPPHKFSMLLRGGLPHRKVEAVVIRPDGSWKVETFDQEGT